ncbi:MAG: hypothetical protein A2V67_06975 [Deltaproteobacteria bacterium RBG_13_61_14]|nr:MAG: hypothetical protein A2V67_06975 [Deltaproteobacteria bacterium RBG_13_61_14]
MIPNPAEPEPKQKRGVSRKDAKMPRVQAFEGDSSSIQTGHAARLPSKNSGPELAEGSSPKSMPLPISRPTAKKQSRKGTTIRGLFFLASNSSLFLLNFESLRLGVNLFFQNHCPLCTACPAFQRGALLLQFHPSGELGMVSPEFQNSEKGNSLIDNLKE